MKVPKKARKVFSGKIFQVYQWRQRLFDGQAATFEMLKRPDTVQVLPIVAGKIWVTSERQPRLPSAPGLFGGRVDRGETPLRAARRELLEEAGLTAKDWELLQVFEPYSKIEWRIYFYIARGCRQVAKPRLEGGEKIARRAVSFSQFLDLVSSAKFGSGDLANYILRLRLDRRKLARFKRTLFPPAKTGQLP